MKKVIALALITVSLASCGQKKEPETKMTPTTNVKVEAPIDALKANQVSVIEKLDSLIIYKEKGITNGKVKFDLKVKEADVNGSLDYNFKFDQKQRASSGSLNAKFKANVKEGQKIKVDGNISLQIAAFKKKVFFKLGELNLNSTENPQEIAMVKGMAEAYIGKWIFTELPEVNETKQIEKLQENFAENKKKVVAILKKYPIFKSIKENKNSDYYDNDVEINKESIVSIAKEMAKEFAEEGKKEISAEEIKNMEKSVEEFNKKVKVNLKIDKKDLKLFVLSIENEKANSKIENTKDNFKIVSVEKTGKVEFSYDAKKTDKSVDGKILIKEDSKEKFNGNLLLEKDGSKYTFDLKGKASENEGSFDLNITNNTVEKDVKIEEPKDAKDIKEVMGAMMGGGVGPQPSGIPAQPSGIPVGQ